MTTQTSRRHWNKFALGAALLFSALGLRAAEPEQSCAPVTSKTDIAAVIRALFAALRADDLPGFRAVTTSDFYAYDGGVAFTGDALMKLIRHAYTAGKKYDWSVTESKAYVACNLAWITYVNKGSVEDSSGQQEVTWLESAILEYGHGRWRIRFCHSTRAPKAVS